VELNKPPGRSYSLFFRLSTRFRRSGVDVVHCHNFAPLLYGSVAGKLARAAVVYTMHGPEAAERYDYARMKRMRLIDHAVAVSEHVCERAIAAGRFGRAHLTTIYNGVDVDRYGIGGSDVRARVRRELGLDDSARAIGVVARLTHEKDHDTLLDAFAALGERHPEATLLIVGDGERRGAMEERVRGLGIGGRVTFLGTRSDVPELLSALDVFVLPSRIEGLGITLMEAMAAGLATVATAVGGIPEVVDTDTGRIVPPGDAPAMAEAMAWLLDHPAEARRMGAAGRTKVLRDFTVESMVERYETLYDRLTGRDARNRALR
jgi:glycosyltransferase involved in cell wall biosynthesis